MTPLRGVREDDIVCCDVRGRVFYARVTDTAPDVPGVDLAVAPITKGITYRYVTARQVTGVWVKRRPRPPRSTQAAADDAT